MHSVEMPDKTNSDFCTLTFATGYMWQQDCRDVACVDTT